MAFISVTIYVVGSVSYSSDLWPRGVGPRGSTLHLAGSREGAAGGPRPPVRPQPPGAPPPQVVWEWSDAEKRTSLSLRPSETTTIWSRGPKSGDFPHVLQVHPQSGGTERQVGQCLCVAPLPHHLGGWRTRWLGGGAVLAPRRHPPGPPRGRHHGAT